MPGPSLAAVRRLAGAASFERGEDYFADGRIAHLEPTEDGDVVATVRGTHNYRVSLASLDHGDVGFDCDCPMGSDGAFCKHCVAVAVALAWRADPRRGTASPVGPASCRVPDGADS